MLSRFNKAVSPVVATEAVIIHRQLHFPTPITTLFTVSRYAIAGDLVIVGASAVYALGTGALIPLPPVRTRASTTDRIRRRIGAPSLTPRHKLCLANYRRFSPPSARMLYFMYVTIGALVTWFLSTAGFAYVSAKLARYIKGE